MKTFSKTLQKMYNNATFFLIAAEVFNAYFILDVQSKHKYIYLTISLIVTQIVYEYLQ